MAKKTKAATTGAAAAAKLAVAASAAGTQARSQASDLGERLAPVVDDVRDRLEDLTETVATRLDDALPDRVTPAAVTRRAARNHPNRVVQALLVLGLGALAAAITHRFTGGSSQEVWRSTADQPTPAAAAGESAHGLIAGNDHASGNVPGQATNAAGETGPVEASVDVAGGTPEEMAADATDTPHEVTTPDQPARKVVLD